MTRNIESVKSWTTRLLKSTFNRRVSLLLIDASVEAEKADTSWNINIEEQLFHWVSNQLDKVINMLNELRSQWDLTLQLNEHWLLVQDDHKKRAKQLEVAFDKNDELEKKNKSMLYLLFSIVIEINDAFTQSQWWSSWHVDSSSTSQSICHLPWTSTRRAWARYFLWWQL